MSVETAESPPLSAECRMSPQRSVVFTAVSGIQDLKTIGARPARPHRIQALDRRGRLARDLTCPIACCCC
jgi:hypothetical protein